VHTYNVLIYEDDPLYLDELEDAIDALNDYGVKYSVRIYKFSSSRQAMECASTTVIDVFILDICARRNVKWVTDDYHYQGYDLYNQLIDHHPKLRYRAKFIVLSNLKRRYAKKAFNYIDADYLYKADTPPDKIAMFLKSYFDADWKKTSSYYNEGYGYSEPQARELGGNTMTKQAGISGGEFHNSPVIIHQHYYEGIVNVQNELETIRQLLEGDDTRLQQKFEELKAELENEVPKKDRKAAVHPKS